MCSEPSTGSRAKRRWKMLIEVLKRQVDQETSARDQASVRRFSTFGLVTAQEAGGQGDSCGTWSTYTCPSLPQHAPVLVRHIKQVYDAESIQGFDNTGNVCVWPSEEILAYTVLKDLDKFRGRRVCELGGGMTCLAGALLGSQRVCEEVLLTDGNDNSAHNLQAIVERNKETFKDKVKARCLLWDTSCDYEDLAGRFDFILAADCFFFAEYRAALLHTCHTLLKPGGTVIAFAPNRKDTFKAMQGLAGECFEVVTSDLYDGCVYDLHRKNSQQSEGLYDPDIHYPLQMLMVKTGHESSPT